MFGGIVKGGSSGAKSIAFLVTWPWATHLKPFLAACCCRASESDTGPLEAPSPSICPSRVLRACGAGALRVVWLCPHLRLAGGTLHVVWLCPHLRLAACAADDHVFTRALSGDAAVCLPDFHVALGFALHAEGVRHSATVGAIVGTTAITGVIAALAQTVLDLAATRLT